MKIAAPNIEILCPFQIYEEEKVFCLNARSSEPNIWKIETIEEKADKRKKDVNVDQTKDNFKKRTNRNRRICRHLNHQWRYNKINQNLIWDICNIQDFKTKRDTKDQSLKNTV